MLPAAPPRNADGNYPVLPVADGYVRVLPPGSSTGAGSSTCSAAPTRSPAPEWDFALFRMVNADAIRLVAARRCASARAPRSSPARSRAACRWRRSTRRTSSSPRSRRARAATSAAPVSRISATRRSPSAPFNFSATPVELRRPAPALDRPARRCRTARRCDRGARCADAARSGRAAGRRTAAGAAAPPLRRTARGHLRLCGGRRPSSACCSPSSAPT